MKKYSLILLPLLSSIANAEDFVIDMREDYKHLNVKDTAAKYKKDIQRDNIEFYNKHLKEQNIKEVLVTTDNSVLPHNDKKLVFTENKLISQILKKLGKFAGKTYILQGQNFIINEGYKISNIEELSEVVNIASDYVLTYTSSKIKNTIMVSVVPQKVAKKITIEANLDFYTLKEIIQKEFNIQTIIPKSVSSKKLKVRLFGTYSFEELIEDLEKQSDIWFEFSGTKLYAHKTKEVVFDVKRNGRLFIDFSNGSSSETGSDSGGGGTVSTGFQFEIGDKNKEDFVTMIKENFPLINFKDSQSGFILAETTPSQFKSITEYFKNIEERYELISGEIILLSLQKNKENALEVGWENLLLNKDLLKVGNNGTLFLDSLNIGATTVAAGVEGANTIGIGARGASQTRNNVGFVQALQQIGNVSIVDRWVISTATGIPAGFTNYQKVPYFTKEQTGTDAAATTTDFGGVIEKFTVNYALTGFKSTFTVNKTQRDSYIIDGAIDYSSIDKFEEREDGSKAPYISGKSMRIYTEFEDLDKTIVIGGFKNLTREENDNETPFLSKIPLIGWLFTKNAEKKSEKEFIVLIKLKKPVQLSETQKAKTYKSLKNVNEQIVPFKEKKKKLSNKVKDFSIFDQ
jgi:type II secretory pathway component GspD/PulD (secretin)